MGHCPSVQGGDLHTGQLVCPGPPPGYGTVYVPATVQGVCILFNGLGVGVQVGPYTAVDAPGTLPTYYGTWVNDLLADNWAVIFFPDVPETTATPTPISGLVTDITSATSGNGTQYLATLKLMQTHLLAYCASRWPGVGIMVAGFSEGGYQAIKFANLSLAGIIGGVIVNPATIWENVNPVFTSPFTFSSFNWSAMDASATDLNACTKPFLYEYGTTDIAVGWQNPGGALPTSNTDAMITNAVAAGMPITRRATSNNHDFQLADVAAWMTFITGTLDPLR